MKIRGSVVSLSLIFRPHPPEDEKKNEKKTKVCRTHPLLDAQIGVGSQKIAPDVQADEGKYIYSRYTLSLSRGSTQSKCQARHHRTIIISRNIPVVLVATPTNTVTCTISTPSA